MHAGQGRRVALARLDMWIDEAGGRVAGQARGVTSEADVSLSTIPTASVAAPMRPEAPEITQTEWPARARQPTMRQAVRSPRRRREAAAMQMEAAAST